MHLYEQHDDHTVRHIYLGNQLVASEHVAGNPAASTPAFFAADHHGTILLATDRDGAIVQQQRYSPFGLASNISATLDRYLGHERDVETGLLHLGMRCYAPHLGRFLSPDWYVLENPDKRCELGCEQEEDRPKLAQHRRRMVEFLLKRGAATNLPGDEPWATLSWSRNLGLAEIEEVLIKHGAT